MEALSFLALHEEPHAAAIASYSSAVLSIIHGSDEQNGGSAGLTDFERLEQAIVASGSDEYDDPRILWILGSWRDAGSVERGPHILEVNIRPAVQRIQVGRDLVTSVPLTERKRHFSHQFRLRS
jgi:hypothetical protein